MKMYSRDYFSLCLILAISGRSRNKLKLNPSKNFPIYGIAVPMGTTFTKLTPTVHLSTDTMWWFVSLTYISCLSDDG